MSVKFEFYVSDEDYDRLYAIKREQGKELMSGNEFAEELLHKELVRLHPETVRFDEETGEEII